MYNRFDAAIARWVSHYNRALSPATPLDPNIVKSMLFQESRLGTSGVHLELPPYSWADGRRHPIRSRFNLGQSIDSYGPHQLLMIREMAPSIYSAHSLADLDRELRRRSMTNADMMAWNGGVLAIALQEFFENRNAAGENLMGTSGRDLHEDYEFWIRAAVRWLFEKYRSLTTPSWEEAVRAYNGSGPRARAYRDAVVGRAGSASPLDVGND